MVDDLENARRGSRELRERFGSGPEAWQGVTVLSDLLGDNDPQPSDPTGLTIFKGMGMGLSDLALARLVYQAATERDLGTRLAPQTRENLLLNR